MSMDIKCNQLCRWNDPSDGCVKPFGASCPLSHIESVTTPKPMTNADRIRAMGDEELAQLLYRSDSLGWCRNLPECAELLDTEDGIPEEKCMECLLRWLRQPAEGA